MAPNDFLEGESGSGGDFWTSLDPPDTKLAEGVYQTTYEDGTRIIVNYNSVPYSDGTTEIPPMDFVLLEGD